MESVAARFLATPAITLGLVALAFVAFFAVLGVGLMLAATAGALPDLTWLYFAFCYFPMYLSPLLLQLARRLIARAEEGGSP